VQACPELIWEFLVTPDDVLSRLTVRDMTLPC